MEFVSANPTGPMHVGHARNAAYGDSLARMLQFAGNRVEREFYVNDAGSQIRKFGESIGAVARGEPVPEDGYQGDYIHELAGRLPEAAALEAGELGVAGVAVMLDHTRVRILVGEFVRAQLTEVATVPTPTVSAAACASRVGMALSPSTETRCEGPGAAASSAPAARSRSAATSGHVRVRESSASATSCGAASALARIAAVTRAPFYHSRSGSSYRRRKLLSESRKASTRRST